jgi:hypothetical protein
MPDDINITSAQVQVIVKQSAAKAFNQLADKVAADSLVEVPLETGTLRASATYPGNDPASAATEDDLEATVAYNTVYAHAQHEGMALQKRLHPSVYIEGVGWRTLTNVSKPHQVMWVVKEYTEPGTKKKFLEDPYKAMIPRMEPFVAASIAKGIDEANTHHS